MKQPTKAVLTAILLTLTLAALAFGQSQEQTTNIKKISDVATPVKPADVPAWVLGARDYARASKDLQAKAEKRISATAANGGETTPMCNEWIVGPPATALAVYDSDSYVWYVVGCDIPTGTWIIADVNYPDNPSNNEQTFWKTDMDLHTGNIASWKLHTGNLLGATFTMTIATPNAFTRQLVTSFDGPVALQSAYEQITQTEADNPGRTLIVQNGTDLTKARVLFGGADITNSVAKGGGFDVSNVALTQGVTYPLTLAQGDTYTTALVLHPNCQNRACSVTAPKPTPTVTGISPNTGTVGTVVTVYGTNLAGAVEVDFDNHINQVVASITQLFVAADGKSLSFTIGDTFGGMVVAGTYQVVVLTPTGTSNGIGFTLVSVPTVATVTVVKNSTVPDQTVSAGASNAVIGSYSITANTAVSLTGLTISTNIGNVQNLRVSVGGFQFGTTQGNVQTGTPYTFSGSSAIPSGLTLTIEVRADILSGANGTFNPATFFQGLTGIDTTSYAAIGIPSPVGGQGVTIATAPAMTLFTYGRSSSDDVVMGSSGVTVLAFQATNASLENEKMTQLTVCDKTTAKLGGFGNLQLFFGSLQVGTATAASTSSNGPCYALNLSVTVPIGNTTTFVLMGDLPPFNNGAGEDAAVHTFVISAVTAVGMTSGKAVSTTITQPSGEAIRVLRTTLTPSIAAIGGTRNSRNAADQVATVVLTPASAGAATLNTLTLTFDGNMIASTAASSAFANGIQLWLNGTPLTSSTPLAVTTTVGTTSAGLTKTWNFSGANAISAGIPLALQVVVNDNVGTTSPTAGIGLGLQVSIQNPGDLVYTDSPPNDSTGKLVWLSANVTPLAAQIVFAPGI